MTTLADAIVRREWELASLCLLLGLWQAVARVPADSIEGVIDLAEGDTDAPKS